VPDKNNKRPKRDRKRLASTKPEKPWYAWDSHEALKLVTDATEELAAKWSFVAHCTKDPLKHKEVTFKARILHALVNGDMACLRELSGRAAVHMRRLGNVQTLTRDRTEALDKMCSRVARDFEFEPPAPSESIAKFLIVLGRGTTGELRQMLAFYCNELFPLTSISLDPYPTTWVRKITAAIDRARPPQLATQDQRVAAAEKMIRQFLLTVGVPEKTARSIWSYRDKRKKRGSDD